MKKLIIRRLKWAVVVLTLMQIYSCSKSNNKSGSTGMETVVFRFHWTAR